MSTRLPEGRITLLFTDIEGSTALLARLGAAYGDVLDQHCRVLRAAFNAGNGHEIGTEGDSFFVVFENPRLAVEAALAGQINLARARWPEGVALRVRMGLHTGSPHLISGNYLGMDVNRAARVSAAGHGGQILISADTLAALDPLPEGWRLREHGRRWLKGLPEPEMLYQVLSEGLADEDRAAGGERVPGLQRRVRLDGPSTEQHDGPRTDATLLDLLATAVRDPHSEIRLSSDELRRLIRHDPESLEAYRLSRVAEWIQPQHQLDERFVSLSLLLDKGEQAASISGRWEEQSERFEDLRALLGESGEPALVLLGPPGSGKSTLLRHLELRTCVADLRGSSEAETLTIYAPLNAYRAGADSNGPLRWLSERWAAACPRLPALDALLRRGRVLLLLDAINEMPHADASEYRSLVEAWRAFMVDALTLNRDNRFVFTCRSLDYSSTLSSPALRVLQSEVLELDNVRVQRFLGAYVPGLASKVWRQLAGTATLDLLRTPYFLSLLVAQLDAEGHVPSGRAALFTGFVRQALRREIERGNPLFSPDRGLLTDREHRRLLHSSGRSKPYDLPARGALVSGLECLAFDMQSTGQSTGGSSQVRIDYEAALELVEAHVDSPETVLQGGMAVAVLDEDVARDEVLFRHQLLQEYFAGRKLALQRPTGLFEQAWTVKDVVPSLDAVIAGLDPPDPLPELPSTGWEETTLLATPLAPDPMEFIARIADENLVLAARAACLPELRQQIPETLLTALRSRLIERSEDAGADLRARIASGRILSELGDPRFEEADGPQGRFLQPPFVRVPAGDVQLGSSEAIQAARPDERPEHRLAHGSFRLARFPVTNAEWARFMAAGGYDDERWWPLLQMQSWRRGETVSEGSKQDWRAWRRRFGADPSLLDDMEHHGNLNQDQAAEWRRRVALSDQEFERFLDGYFPSRRLRNPLGWSVGRFNHPSQPVVGVSWYEALAYCHWLSAQTGESYRLPSELEWAAAARGSSARTFAWGDDWVRLRANGRSAHVRKPSPVGIFPEGKTVDGIDDMTGNCFEWTCSLYGLEDGKPSFGYPYDAHDGREDLEAPAEYLRVARGGSWEDGEATIRCAYRYPLHPALRHHTVGFRMLKEIG